MTKRTKKKRPVLTDQVLIENVIKDISNNVPKKDIANKYNKPVIVHMRDAVKDTYDLLKETQGLPILINISTMNLRLMGVLLKYLKIKEFKK